MRTTTIFCYLMVGQRLWQISSFVSPSFFVRVLFQHTLGEREKRAWNEKKILLVYGRMGNIGSSSDLNISKCCKGEKKLMEEIFPLFVHREAYGGMENDMYPFDFRSELKIFLVLYVFPDLDPTPLFEWVKFILCRCLLQIRLFERSYEFWFDFLFSPFQVSLRFFPPFIRCARETWNMFLGRAKEKDINTSRAVYHETGNTFFAILPGCFSKLFNSLALCTYFALFVDFFFENLSKLKVLVLRYSNMSTDHIGPWCQNNPAP